MPHAPPPAPLGHPQVSISDFLTLFSARTHEGFFWSVRPSPVLLVAGLLALSLSTTLACIWPTGYTDKVPVEGLAKGSYTLLPLWIWLYCVFWWFVQDAFKVAAYWVMHRWVGGWASGGWVRCAWGGGVGALGGGEGRALRGRAGGMALAGLHG